MPNQTKDNDVINSTFYETFTPPQTSLSVILGSLQKVYDPCVNISSNCLYLNRI